MKSKFIACAALLIVLAVAVVALTSKRNVYIIETIEALSDDDYDGGINVICCYEMGRHGSERPICHDNTVMQWSAPTNPIGTIYKCGDTNSTKVFGRAGYCYVKAE